MSDFITLGIESSCDDTAAAVLGGERDVLSSVLWSQAESHSPHGGVVPELAGRRHQEDILPVVSAAMEAARVRGSDLSLIAVTAGPGLMGSLMVGVMAAKALSQTWGVPVLAVNHMEGHIYGSVVGHPELCPPFLSLTVSGGHTEIVHVREFGRYELLGCTRDDAVGEAYDKLAKIMGLGYPGGPVIDRMSREGRADGYSLPTPMKGSGIVEFSFSGLKTAALWAVKRDGEAERVTNKADLCASFQHAAVSCLLEKLFLAVKQTGVRSVSLSGGVAANSELRSRLVEEGKKKHVRTYLPPMEFCTDNAVMIAAAGYAAWQRGVRSEISFAPNPSWEL